jgi:acetyl esterase/lipase
MSAFDPLQTLAVSGTMERSEVPVDRGRPMRLYKPLSLLLPLLLSFSTTATASQPQHSVIHDVVRIWPTQAPETEDWKAAEEGADVTLPDVGKIHVITNVTVPTLTVFRPAAGKANGTAMVVLPGGSFRALAWDVDGLETAEWLASKGITAFVLKYRVRPPQQGESFGATLEDFAWATRRRRAIAVADAQQAIRFIRSHARQYSIAPDRIGIIGFSAGAMATIDVALTSDASVRPNFAAAMYGAALTQDVPSAGAPPLFIGAAADDPQLPAINSVEIFRRWSKAGLPAELHIYEKGGHGFGFRRHRSTSDNWPASFQAWLASHGYLSPAQRHW